MANETIRSKSEWRYEVQRAIQALQCTSNRKPRAFIRYLPTQPSYEYAFTCDDCGGHVSSHVPSGPLWDVTHIEICSLCSGSPFHFKEIFSELGQERLFVPRNFNFINLERALPGNTGLKNRRLPTCRLAERFVFPPTKDTSR